VRYWHVLVLATLLGAAQAIDTPSRQAFVVELSGKGDMANAIALNAGIFHGARVIGPALAGILVAAMGIPAAFLVNGLSFLAVLGGLLLMDGDALHHHPRKDGDDGDLLGGVRYLARDRHARGLFFLIFWSALLTMPYHVLVPIYAREIFGGEAGTYGSSCPPRERAPWRDRSWWPRDTRRRGRRGSSWWGPPRRRSASPPSPSAGRGGSP
jgi:MFS family permease